MKISLFALFTFLLLCVLPSVAQDTTRTVAFNDYSFRYPSTLAENVRITTYAGDPLDQPAPTMAGLQPPYAQIELYNDGNYRPELTMWLIQTTNLVGYPEEITLNDLQSLLLERPELSSLEQILTTASKNPLPSPPLRGSAQILTARADYVETEIFVGIRYLIVYAQDMYPLTSDSFRYLFVGVSKDGSTYIRMETFLRTDLFPDSSRISSSDLDAFYLDPNANYQQGIEIVDAAPANAFTPSLDDLEALLNSLRFDGSGE